MRRTNDNERERAWFSTEIFNGVSLDSNDRTIVELLFLSSDCCVIEFVRLFQVVPLTITTRVVQSDGNDDDCSKLYVVIG